ncbi:MAG: class I SAM-dependent methyltransferase [Clostridiales bacterium]|nr:class I SAM-dependent methyltransferase [Clostridiales bacterium]
MRKLQITNWCHEMIRSQVPKGGLYVDATMGNGNDTLFLCEMAGSGGKVLAFDIQPPALEATRALLKTHNLTDKAELILDSHENIDHYLDAETADAVCFNFGYLPGGDHRICTRPETSLLAVRKSLTILKKGGLLSLCIYSGGDTGFQEKEALLDFLKTLPSREYTVIANEYLNRGNHPPIPVFVWKESDLPDPLI